MFIQKEESLSNVLHLMAILAAEDWYYALPGGAEIVYSSKKDLARIIAAPGQYAVVGYLVLGLLDVACKLVGPLEVIEHGVSAGFIFDDIPLAHLNILPKPNLSSNLTTDLFQAKSDSSTSESSSKNNGALPNLTVEATSTNPRPPSRTYQNDGWIADPLDFRLRIYYRQLSTTYEDVDLWTAFLSAMASAAVPDRDAQGAWIRMRFLNHDLIDSLTDRKRSSRSQLALQLPGRHH